MPLGGLATAGLISSGVGALGGIVSGIGNLFSASKIKPVWKDYQTSKGATDMLGLAQTRLNSNNPYASANRRSILGSQANALAKIKSSVLDPSQAMALAVSSQGQADQSSFNQGQQDWVNGQQNVTNLMNAQNAIINEDHYGNQSMAQKYAMDMGQKNALQSSGMQSIVGGLQNIGSSLIGAQGLQNQKDFGNSYLNTFGKMQTGSVLGNAAKQALASSAPVWGTSFMQFSPLNVNAPQNSNGFGTNYMQYGTKGLNNYSVNPYAFGTNYNGIKG